MIIDRHGNLIGTTGARMEGNFFGTSYNGGGRNFGSVWKVSADGATETVLYSFRNNVDGAGVDAGLVADSEGNLFGTNGTIVYRLTPEGHHFAIIYTFPDGYGTGRMIIDRHGNLIGTTGALSSDCDSGECGTIFQVKD